MADTRKLSAEEILAEVGWMRSLARSLVRDESVADDLVQETWVAALRRPPDPNRPLRPWLATVLGNFARMRLRAGSTRAGRERAGAREESLPDSSELVDRMETQQLLARRVAGLEEPYRSTILLRYYEGLSAAEIARRTKTPAGTVRWRLNQALKILRTQLDDSHDGDRDSWCRLLLPIAFVPEGAGLAESASAGEAAVGSSTLPWGGWAVGAASIVALTAVLWFGAAALLRSPDDALGVGATARVEPVATRAAGDSARPGPEVDLRAPRGPSAVSVPSAAGAFELRAQMVDPLGAPLEGVEVALLGTERSARSDASGGFVLVGARDDAVRASGLELRANHALARRLPAEALELVPGGVLELGQLVLAPAGAIEGTVRDEEGVPLAGVRVALEPLASRWQSIEIEPLEEARVQGSLLDESAPATVTDDVGRYRFSAVAVGFARVWTQAPWAFSEHSQPIAVRAGETSDAGTLVLTSPPERAWISGRVVGPDGRGVAGAELECARHSTQSFFFQGEPWVFHGRADDEGRFRMLVGSYRNYDVAARDPAGTARECVLRRLPMGASDVRIQLAAPERLAVEVFDAAGIALTEPTFDWVDRDRGKHLGGVARVVRDSAPGAFSFDLPSRPAWLRVRHAGHRAQEIGPFLADADPPDARVELQPTPQVRGRVLDRANVSRAGVPGVRVELLRVLAEGRVRLFPELTAGGVGLATTVDGAASLARTGPDGAFALDLDMDGTYRVRTQLADGRSALSPAFTWRMGEVAPAIDVEVEPGGALVGAAVASDGRAVTGRVIGVTCGDGYVRSVRVDSSGAFRFDGLASGSWQLVELAAEYAQSSWRPFSRSTAPPALLEGAARAPSAVVRTGVATAVELDLGAVAAARLVGRLRIDGAAPGPWIVQLVRRGAAEQAGAQAWTACIDPEGRFELALPAGGRYALELRPAGGLDPLRVLDEVELAIGRELSWELSFDTARLTVENVPVFDPRRASHERYYVWADGGQRVVAARLNGDAQERCVLPRVPAGSGQLVLVPRAPRRGPSSVGAPRTNPRHGDVLRELDLEPGGEQTLRLP